MARHSGPLRLEILLDSYDDRIEGRVGDGHGTVVPFSGWLELMAAVGTLTGARPDRARDSEGDDDEEVRHVERHRLHVSGGTDASCWRKRLR